MKIKLKNNHNNKIRRQHLSKRFSRYSNRLIKASLYIYSTPKYKANIVSVSTKDDDTKAKLSIQKTK